MSLEPTVLRICIVGAESTGTTTLARELAQHYHTLWVPEYGREYTERLVRENPNVHFYQWRSEEFMHLAEEQQRREDEAARRASRVLFCDTDALATAIWHEHYLGSHSPAVEALARQRLYALYILTACDVPFEQDSIREGEHTRAWMTRRFEEELALRPEPWIKVSGSRQERMKTAVAAIDHLLEGHPS
ncbi:MAG: ATP-binding protein [Acidobacteriota bacterium]|nr:ATP-binding protein [Acidobacteriota bacterium]